MEAKPQVKFGSAVRWAMVMNWGTQGIAALVTFVLAAILGPRDYGLVAMAMLYIAFIQMFLAQGFGAAIVQRKDLQTEHLDSVFWMTMVGGVLLACVSVAFSGFWEMANREPGLAKVINVLSVILVIRGLTIVQESLLKRKMDFKSLAMRSNVAALCGGALGVGMAVKGMGVWSLVGQELCTSVTEVILLWRLGDWRPRLRFSWNHMKDVFGFSLHVFSAQIGSFVQRRSDAILIGLFFGPVAVGLYRLADRLVNLVIEIATRPFTVVALPHFSRYQGDEEGMRQSVLRCIKSTTLVTLPIMALIAGLSGLICLTLGSKWVPAADVIRVLCFIGASRAVTLFAGPLLQAVGRPRYFARMTWFLAAANVIGYCTVGFLLGGDARQPSEQALGMAAARAVIFCLLYAPLNVAMIMLASKISLSQLFWACCRGLLGGGVSFIIAFLGVNLFEGTSVLPIVRLAICGVVSVGVGVAVTLSFDAELREMLIGQVRGVVDRRRRRRSAETATATAPATPETGLAVEGAAN